MPRVFTATKNKGGKKTYKCERCRTKIEPGQSYFYYTPYRAKSRRIRCSNHRPRPSELTSSETLSVVYGTQEALEDACRSASDGDDLISALDEAYSAIDDLVSTLEDKISNVESAFEYGTPVLDTLNEYRDNAETYRDSIDSAKSEAESRWDEYTSEEPDDEESDEHGEWEDKRDEAISDMTAIIDDIDCPF